MEAFSSLLEAERGWLARQTPFVKDWKDGCRWVEYYVNTWVNDYAQHLLTQPVGPILYEKCRERLWRAWAYYWRQVAEHTRTIPEIGPLDVADALQNGIRPTTGDSLGGDPLRDVVFSGGAVAGDGQALRCFSLEYESVFEQEVRRLGCREPDFDQWHDLVSRLVVSTRKRPAWLESYGGHSSLRTWLRPVVRNFLVDQLRRSRRRRLREREFAILSWGSGVIGTAYEVIHRENLAALSTAVGWALSSLSAEDQTILFLCCHQGWSNNAVAGYLRRSAGWTSRLRENAIDRFTAELRTVLAASHLPTVTGMNWERQFALLVDYALHYLDVVGPEVNRPEQTPLETGEEQKAMENTMLSSLMGLPIQGKALPRKTSQIPNFNVVGDAPPLVPPSTEKFSSLDIPVELIVTVNLKEEPESFFQQMRAKLPENRPSVVCLKAWGDATMASEAIAWLGRLDAVILAQYKNPCSDPYEPHRAVFLHSMAAEALPPELYSRSDILWVFTEEEVADVRNYYREKFRKDLESFLNPNRSRLLPDVPNPAARDVADSFHNKSLREAWNARMEELSDCFDDEGNGK